MEKNRYPLPVTLLSGFLGSGKTTLLKHILESRDPNLKVAVLVNDMAELNIDAALVKNANVLQQQEKMIEMHNGCICCTLREDLLLELTRLALSNHFDAILIESTGVSEPQQVAETFTFALESHEQDGEEDEQEDEEPEEAGRDDQDQEALSEKVKAQAEKRQNMLEDLGEALAQVGQVIGHMPQSLNDITRLDTCVTVIDCQAFSGDITSCATLLERYHEKGGVDEEDDRNIAELFIDQIEFANVVLLNKTDLVQEKEIQAIRQLVHVLNPTAKVVLTQHSKVPCEAIVNTGLFNMDVAARSAGWLKSLQEEVKPETEEYGIGSFVYRARTPFHPRRIHQFLEKLFLLELVIYDEVIEEEKAMNEDESEAATVVASEKSIENEDEEDDQAKDEDEELSDEAAKAKRDATYAQCQKYMKANFGQIFRSKGFMWLAGRDFQFAEWSQAGANGEISCGDPWMAVMPPEAFPEKDTDVARQIQKDMVPGLIQDRRQELVFIGQELKKEALIKALDECLLKPEDNPKSKVAKGTSEDERKNAWKFGWKPKDPETDGDLLPPWPSVEGQLMALIESDDLDEEEHNHGPDGDHKCSTGDSEPKKKRLKKSD